MAGTTVRVSNQDRLVTDTYVFIGGRWVPVVEVYAKVGGEWKRTFVKERVIEISNNDSTGINLLDLFEYLYGTPTPGTRARFVIKEGVEISSQSTSTPAITATNWPDKTEVIIENYGKIIGAGGEGGSASDEPFGEGGDGGDGGTAILTSVPTSIYNAGSIYGGGGGGGAGGNGSAIYWDYQMLGGAGGGGAGKPPGSPGQGNGTANPGSNIRGGSGSEGHFWDYQYYDGSKYHTQVVSDAGDGGRGGDLGQPGQDGQNGYYRRYDGGSPSSANPAGGKGGRAGAYVQGISHVTWIDSEGEPTSDRGDVKGLGI